MADYDHFVKLNDFIKEVGVRLKLEFLKLVSNSRLEVLVVQLREGDLREEVARDALEEREVVVEELS